MSTLSPFALVSETERLVILSSVGRRTLEQKIIFGTFYFYKKTDNCGY